MNLESPITEVKGIGAKTEKLMNKIGVYTVGDILLHYPRDYVRFKEPLSAGEITQEGIYAVIGKITSAPVLKRTNRMEIVQAKVRDTAGSVELIWFRMPYVRNQLKSQETYIFYGKVKQKGRQFCMEQPQIYTTEQYQQKMQTLQPVYARTDGLSNQMITKTILQALEEISLSYEYLPEEIRKKEGLCEYNFAIRQIHFPENMESLTIARKRLVFDEFFLFILNMQMQKEKKIMIPNDFPIENETVIPYILSHLPYSLTKAQKKCFDEILTDMKKGTAMQRLVQGDVGSGKTIVAVLALFNTALSGCQGAMMAPTEVLARQHYASICNMLETYDIPVKAVLLTGSMTAKEKRRAYDRIECGFAKIIIGTHALIQDAVNYDNLALVVTDEQHRFGVKQRESFAQKGGTPHVLVMSATPIPRTLAIILYGELDISVIDELPANRIPIKNCVVDTGYRQTAYQFMKKQIAEGRQCYVICPMVEESENMEAENVTDYSRMLQDEMGADVQVGCLHGKMKQVYKDEIMQQFAENQIQILVSTTVIEVGIDVPNATVMLIFMTGSDAKETKKRLDILNHSNDGFKIASEDLKLRGPGDLFGIRQSGLMDFKIGDIYQDAAILQMANEAADWILEEYPEWLKKIPDYERTSSVII